MKELLQNENIRKCIKLFAVSLGVILVIKYLLPLFWPFVLAYFLGELVCRLSDFLNRKLQFHYKVAAIFSLVVIVILIFVLLALIINKLLGQVQNLGVSWPKFQNDLDCGIKEICCNTEKRLRINNGLLYQTMCDGMDEVSKVAKKNVFVKIMSNSKSVVIVSVEIIAAIIVAVMAAYFYVVEKSDIKEKIKGLFFYNELSKIKSKMSIIFRAYIKAQLVIMLITSTLCSIGFALIKNPYFLILGIVVGLLDALPLIGLGIIMIPWAVGYFIIGNVRKGLVIAVVYIICYFVREILEPKLIGDNAGIGPLTSLVCIYIGYEIFGLLGVFLGPIAYMIIQQMTE